MRQGWERRGYTLIEVMIVTTILGILVAIVVVPYIEEHRKATVAATLVNLNGIATAIETYRVDNQSYPPSGSVSANLMGAPYMNSTPTSPGTGGGLYGYAVDPARQTYTIIDPDTYDPVLLRRLNMASATPANGDVALSGSRCGPVLTCMRIGYSNDVGIFAY